MTKEYEVRMEIAGSLAMFARPDTGATPTSYPVPTWSAAKAIFESIAFFKDGKAWIDPERVEICRTAGQAGGSIRYQRYTTNYGGPLRRQSQRSGGDSFQLFATVIVDACYRLHGVVRGPQGPEPSDQNPRHHLRDLFTRRLKQGRCHRTPCLGWREFTASYWGPFRDGQGGRGLLTERDTELNLKLPALLHSVFDPPVDGRYEPRSMYDVDVVGGELFYKKPGVPLAT